MSGFTIQPIKTPLRKGRVIILVAVLIIVGLYLSTFISVREERKYVGEWTNYEKAPNGTEVYTFWNGTQNTIVSNLFISPGTLRQSRHGLPYTYYFYDLVYGYNIYGENIVISVELNDLVQGW